MRKKLPKLETLVQQPPLRKVNTAHPLEGKYVVFLFSADYTDDTEGLTICQVTNGKLEEAWHPCDHINPLLGNIGEGVTDEQAIRYLTRRKVTTVYTFLGNPDTYLGLTLQSDDGNTSFSYDALSGFGVYPEWKSRFREYGINLRTFDPYRETGKNARRKA